MFVNNEFEEEVSLMAKFSFLQGNVVELLSTVSFLPDWLTLKAGPCRD